MSARCDVKLIGIGGAGRRILDVLTREWMDVPESVVVHTRMEGLEGVESSRAIPLGALTTEGLSTGGDPEIGRRAAEESADRIRPHLDGAHVVLIVTGLGGGTGSGAAPVLARMARETGALTLVFCTLPFFFEGVLRRRSADESLTELRKAADAVVVFPNQRLFEWMGPDCGVEESFHKSAETVASSLRALWMLLSRHGVINLDLSDVRRMARQSDGVLALAHAEAQGEDRAAQVARLIQTSPMLEHGSVFAAAHSVLVGVLGGPDLTLMELQTVMAGLSELVRPDTVIHFGTLVDPESTGRIHVTALATEQVAVAEAVPPPEPEPAPSIEPGAESGDEKAPRTPRGRKVRGGKSTEQGVLPLDGIQKGRFVSVDPTIYDGRNLDEPTFMRRGIRLSR